MTEFIEGYDGAFFDLDGVLYRGPEAIPGAVEGVGRLHERGLRTMYVTNNAARSTRTVSDHLSRLGFDASEPDVVSSAQAMGALLRERLPQGSRVLVLGTDNLADHVREAGMVTVDGFRAEPAAVVQGYDPAMTWPRLDQGAFSLQRGAQWFVTNTDSTRPERDGIVPGAGTQVASLRAAVDHDPQAVVGKPHRPLMAEAIRRSGAQNPVFVGDRIDTDIMGAHAVGIDSFMVFTGASGVRDLCFAPSNGRPTAIGWNVLSLFEPRRVATTADGVTRCGGATVSVDAGGQARIEGDMASTEGQLDAAWALATLLWSGAARGADDAWAEFTLLP
ncbi:HAD-IIA family hydrolase [Propioniciclava coleopterorum]|uniref:HAD-IIA family hydrolase n=1 Tax=Propioniciclava coleopterorum TaxID=2714937 RepID=A0A6G7Y8U0_9ACTN|nr:HAD-IIA family hydrolase [Propioniciclava coleopterorum]QIK73225.1 HAD-IIA family hydrolase [Propioniciclava coleopterorum]